MEITINAILFNGPDNIETFPINVDESKYKLVLKKLESERGKMIYYLKDLKKQGKIKSIFRPKNIQMQQTLNKVCKAKKQAKKTIEKLNTIYK